MKYLSIILGLVCVGLVIALVTTKQGDNAQHTADLAAITDFSNQLDAAQTVVSVDTGTLMILSNSVDQYRSASLTSSNQLLQAQSTIAQDSEQITNLTQQVADGQSENQTLEQRIAGYTNQVAGLLGQIAAAKASLGQTNQDLVQAYKDYSLLENRFRRNVAARVVEERKFCNADELRAQLERVKEGIVEPVSRDSIYADLDVEVNSNGSFHVLSKD